MRGIRTPTYPALPECSAVKTSMVAPKFNACREADVETLPVALHQLTVVPRAINPNPPRDTILASSRGSVGFNLYVGLVGIEPTFSCIQNRQITTFPQPEGRFLFDGQRKGEKTPDTSRGS